MSIVKIDGKEYHRIPLLITSDEDYDICLKYAEEFDCINESESMKGSKAWQELKVLVPLENIIELKRKNRERLDKYVSNLNEERKMGFEPDLEQLKKILTKVIIEAQNGKPFYVASTFYSANEDKDSGPYLKTFDQDRLRHLELKENSFVGSHLFIGRSTSYTKQSEETPLMYRQPGPLPIIMDLNAIQVIRTEDEIIFDTNIAINEFYENQAERKTI